MKKIYTVLAIAAMAFSANATIYVVGDGYDLTWSADAPKVVEAVDGVYSFTATNVAAMKISTAFGDWDTFNAAALRCALTEATIGQPVDLAPGDGNIMMPWTGDWSFVIPESLATLTATTTTPKPVGYDIYVRGGMNGWGVDDAWKFSVSADNDKVYVFTCAGETTITAGVEFKIADASWGQINYGPDGVIVPDEFGSEWFHNAGNAMLEEDFEGVIEFYLPESSEANTLVIFNAAAGVKNVTVDNNAAKEYFNLQGVRVANPENGLFIVRQGNQVSKVLVK